MEEQIVRHIHENANPSFPDSITIGTPGKGGEMKVYFNASNMEEATKRLEAAYAVLLAARGKIGV